MDERNKDFQELCDAVVAGAGDATTHFREAVVPHLRTIMRRSLRRKQGQPAFDGHPQGAGLKIAERSRGGDEARVDRAARRLCETLIEALPSPPGRLRKETVVESPPHGTIVLVPGIGRQIE